MSDIEDKITKIQEEIRNTPYHKGTEHYIGLLKAKLAKLREELLERAAKKSRGGVGFAIPKQGDATCVLAGLPSVGKSTILAKLTAAKPKIAPYPFTTLSVIPGMMEYKGAKIQILDVPGIVGGAAKGVGRGREVLSIARIADLLIIVAEAEHFAEQKEKILTELSENGIRINKTKPAISIKRLNSGGLKIAGIPDYGLEKIQIASIAKELGLVNAQIQIKSKISTDDLIDVILANRVFLAAIFAASKADLGNSDFGDDVVMTSALKNWGIDKLKEKIWQKLGLISIYLKPLNGQPDFENPLILKYGSKVSDAAKKISKELAQNLKSAEILRKNFKKRVNPKFQLEEEDIVTFLRK